MSNLPYTENFEEGDFDVKEWVIIQLSGLARARLSLSHIRSVIKKSLNQVPLIIYFPVTEDYYGKQDSGYGEYVFINYVFGTDYYALEELEEFILVLKHPHTKKPQLLSNEEVKRIRDHIYQEVKIHKNDVVKVTRGNLRGNYGIVNFVNGDTVSVKVQLGQESLESTMLVQNVRKSKKRTLIRKKDMDTG
jgi:transcription antitermination factor NusG